MVLANSIAMLMLLLMMVTNGFSIVYPAIPPYMVSTGWCCSRMRAAVLPMFL